MTKVTRHGMVNATNSQLATGINYRSRALYKQCINRKLVSPCPLTRSSGGFW